MRTPVHRASAIQTLVSYFNPALRSSPLRGSLDPSLLPPRRMGRGSRGRVRNIPPNVLPMDHPPDHPSANSSPRHGGSRGWRVANPPRGGGVATPPPPRGGVANLPPAEEGVAIPPPGGGESPPPPRGGVRQTPPQTLLNQTNPLGPPRDIPPRSSVPQTSPMKPVAPERVSPIRSTRSSGRPFTAPMARSSSRSFLRSPVHSGLALEVVL